MDELDSERSRFFADAHAATQLPPELQPFAEALDLVGARPHYDRGWLPYGYPDAPPEPLISGAPPHDGIYRGSWISPGVCLCLALCHPSVPPQLAQRLRVAHAAHVGAGDTLYVYGIVSRSQRTNRDAVLAALARMIHDARRERDEVLPDVVIPES